MALNPNRQYPFEMRIICIILRGIINLSFLSASHLDFDGFKWFPWQKLKNLVTVQHPPILQNFAENLL